MTRRLLLQLPLPALEDCRDKDGRGRVLVVAGSAEVPGAAILCGLAALRAGAGKLQFAAATSWAQQLAFAVPEAKVVKVPGTRDGDISSEAAPKLLSLAASVDAVVVGPGMSDASVASRLAACVVSANTGAKFVIDAASLTDLGRHAQAVLTAAAWPIITPHAGEMASLLEVPKAQVERDPIGAAATSAKALGAVVVMKGATT